MKVTVSAEMSGHSIMIIIYLFLDLFLTSSRVIILIGYFVTVIKKKLSL